MGVAERKGRERAEREARIVAVAESVAEAEGWPAVTIRRLANEIEYSQPVLYSHFANRDAIVAAVALDGFHRLANVLRESAATAGTTRAAALAAASAYLAFAGRHPALYEAMFTLPTPLRFAHAETPPELTAAFAALAAASAPDTDDDDDAHTETFWAALHGLAELERSGRIRVAAREERLALLVGALIKR
ncbi:MAG: helix-turn-helix domain containing protein [Beijerinckiaceae bacterium]|nr:helix-turn-helix domain containing protein [Beijerinckiaceae bacterium]